MARWTGFAALDWSGAVGERHRGIAVATCRPGNEAPKLVTHLRGWSRSEVLDWLVRKTASGAWLVGFDFSPALPFVDLNAYFPGWPDGPADARTLWRFVEQHCAHEPHLAAASFADNAELSRYYRRQGKGTGDLFGTTGAGRLRVTERAQRNDPALPNPSSCFNLVGAAQVGKASLAGMRWLGRLNDRLPVWPFDPQPEHGSCLVEIYTSIAARSAGVRGGTKMRDAGSLDRALAVLGSQSHAALSRYDDHATDALLSAAWLRNVADEPGLWSPPRLTPEIARTEGWTFGVP